MLRSGTSESAEGLTVEVLGKIGDPEAAEGLVELARMKTRLQRPVAIALGSHPHAKAADWLVQMVKEGDENVLFVADRALRALLLQHPGELSREQLQTMSRLKGRTVGVWRQSDFSWDVGTSEQVRWDPAPLTDLAGEELRQRDKTGGRDDGEYE
jgi:hypothetical protein